MASGYLIGAVCRNERKGVVQQCLKDLEPRAREFDAIAVCGVSGLSIGAILAHLLDKHLVVVRKDSESSHGGRCEYPDSNLLRVLIVDDFVSTGGTVYAILNRLKEYEHYTKMQPVGLYLWNASYYREQDGPAPMECGLKVWNKPVPTPKLSFSLEGLFGGFDAVEAENPHEDIERARQEACARLLSKAYLPSRSEAWDMVGKSIKED